MKNLIYKTQDYNFNAIFMDYVHAYDSKKLNFNTREEYLNWVKQWKEDMNIVVYQHTRNKYTYKRDACVLPVKIAKYQSLLDKMPELTDVQKARIEVLKQQYLSDYNLPSYFYHTTWLIWHLLIIRKAAKIKANAQRSLRLLAVA